MFRSFFWSDKSDQKNVHTIKWKEICCPVEEGGLGVRDTKENNLALLAKTCWRFLTDEDHLSSRILKEKYCPNKSLWDARLKNENSWF